MTVGTESPTPVVADAAGGVERQTITANLARRETKLKRILAVLARGISLNRFEAEPLGDHCLHTTVAKIESYGITVARREERVRGYMGHATRCRRYWLDPAECEKAASLLGWSVC